MTTAQSRAVPSVLSGFRAALMATASAGLLLALAPAANAASCATTANNDTCVINLANIADTHDGQGQGTAAGDGDTLQFNDNVNALTIASSQIGTGALAAGKNFVNFEFAEVVNGTTLTVTSASATNATPAVSKWTIDATSTLIVSGAGGNAINDTSSMIVNGTFSVIESEAVGSLSGSGSVIISASEILSAGANGSSTTFSGVISGAGGFTKAGSGILTLTGNNSYTGATTVAGGTLEIGVGGDIAQSSSVTVNAGAWLTGRTSYVLNGPVTNNGFITGNVTVNGNVTSNGALIPGNTATIPGSSPAADRPGQEMGSIYINGNYSTSGTGALIGMLVDIDAALAVPGPGDGTPGVTHDFVTIDNLAAGGPIGGANRTRFELAPFTATQVGGVTSGNGIQLLRITGANNGTEFYQYNSLVAGAHQYLLRYVANYSGNDDGYFLQSAARDELVAHAGLLSAGQSLIRGCFRDEQRIPDSPKNATYGRAWFGYRQGSNSFGADTGVEQDQDYSCSTGGMDWRMGAGWFGGVSGGFGSSSGDIVVPSGNASLDGDARVIEAYAAFTSSAFFLNLSAGYADMDWTMTAPLGFAVGSSGGFIGSAQAGIGLGLEPIAVKLIGTVSYDGTNCGDSCMGVAVSEDTGLIEAKGAIRFDGITWGGSIRPWAQVGYSTVLSDGINTIKAGPYAIVSDTNDELLTIDGGLQTYLDENLSLYVDGGYNESLSKDISGYRAGIGMKLYW